MNLPNILTLSRIPLLFAITVCLFLPFPGAATLALFFFVVAGVTDWLDGKLARQRGLVSHFGILMDALTDKILMVGIFITLLAVEILPAYTVFLLLLILSREFLITGMRLVAASNGLVLGAEKAGKQKTVTQIIAAGLLLAVPVVQFDLLWATGWEFTTLRTWIHTGGILFFVLATILTVSSGVKYVHKYRGVFVTGEGYRP